MGLAGPGNPRALARGESAKEIALLGGELDERRSINGTITHVIGLSRQLANGCGETDWVTSGYGSLALIVPVLVALPGYLLADLSLRALIMVVGAFN
ncbi:MAG TPA: hypothetical protein VMM15_26015 [Bradyrhizobium sp.]|nr:hypothetical protein [Bradyrhizobium sp.]